MQLRLLTDLDALAERLAAKRGRCRYCEVTHPSGQCQQPKNWAATEPAIHSNARADIWEANKRGQEAKGVEPKERRTRIYNGWRWR